MNTDFSSATQEKQVYAVLASLGLGCYHYCMDWWIIEYEETGTQALRSTANNRKGAEDPQYAFQTRKPSQLNRQKLYRSLEIPFNPYLPTN